MKSSTRILHIVPALLGPGGIYGGAERYAIELARCMASLHPTRLVCFGDRPGRITEGDLKIYTLRNWLPFRRFAGSPCGGGLLRHLIWADVIHVHQTHTMAASAALLIGRLLGKPVFTTDLNGGGLCLQNFVDTHGWYTGHLWVSEFGVSGHPRGPHDRIIYGGVDAERFTPGPEEARCGAGGGGYVLFLGRLIPSKGVDVLIDALPPELPLTVIGPRYDSRYFAQLQQLATGKQGRFMPPGGDAELLVAYQRALCMVLPSLSRLPDGRPLQALPEPLGLTLLESMACATPVICSRVGGMPEIVEDGVTGFVVPEGDPAALRERLTWISDHPVEARAVGLAARQRVLDRFTWRACAQRCLDAYDAVPR